MVAGRLMRSGLAVLLTSAVACGGGKHTTAAKAPPTATTTTVAATTTSSSPTAAADTVLAQSLVLQQADFPPGWTAKPHTKDPLDAADAEQLAACVGAPSPKAEDTADVDGPDVDMADAEASTSASLVRTLADAQADLAAVRGPKFSPCVKTYVAKTIQAQLQRDTPGATLQSLALDRLSVPTYADATEAFRVTAVVRVQGQTLTVYVDLVFILKQRVEASASFSNLNQTFDPALERALLAKFGAKLEGIH